MLSRAFSALGRLITLSLFGTFTFLMIPLVLLGAALMFALGLVAVVGLFGGLICLLMKDYQTGLMLLGAGAGAWVGNMLIWDRLFGTFGQGPVAQTGIGPSQPGLWQLFQLPLREPVDADTVSSRPRPAAK